MSDNPVIETQSPTNTAVLNGQVPNYPITQTVSGSYYNPEKEIDKLYKWLYAIVIAIGVAFFFMLFDFIREKDLIIGYGNLSDKYFDRYTELNNSFHEVKEQCLLSGSKIESLETENKNTVSIMNCFKDKDSWQYNQCFK